MLLKKISIILLIVLVPFSLFANDELSDIISNINLSAQKDLQGFKGKLSLSFGVDNMKVESVLNITDSPADAYMIFRVAEIANRTPEEVIAVYKKNKKNGWGRIAKDLGIKPGSREFKELKKDKFIDEDGDSKGKGKGKTKNKGKAHHWKN